MHTQRYCCQLQCRLSIIEEVQAAQPDNDANFRAAMSEQQCITR